MGDLQTRPGDDAIGSRLGRVRVDGGRRLAPVIYQRRRRAGALALACLLALGLGLVVGAGQGARGHHLTAVSPRDGPGVATIPPGSAAALERARENGAISRTLAYTPYVRMAGSQHREVALTFDDGPGPYTPEVIAVLSHEHVPATFFEVGVAERYFHAATAEIVAARDPIGDHTETHAPMSRLSSRRQEQQLLEQTASIGDYGAPFPRMFRPPYGLWNSATLALLHKYRMLMVLWSVDTDDWQMPGVDQIVDRALEGARPGAIILLHDAGGDRAQTVAALPQIIHGLRKRGYRLVTVPRLLLDNPPPADQDVAGLRGAGG